MSDLFTIISAEALVAWAFLAIVAVIVLPGAFMSRWGANTRQARRQQIRDDLAQEQWGRELRRSRESRPPWWGVM